MSKAAVLVIFSIYFVLVAAVAGHKACCSDDLVDSHELEAGGSMTWAEVKDNIEVKAMPDGTWTWAYDYVKGPALIQIEADGRWHYNAEKECSADGHLNAVFSSQNTILPDAPVGALLAKIGGSTAGAKDGRVYLVGSRCLLEIDEKTSGPIFLTINDELTGMSDNSGSVTVKISIARPATPASPPSSPAPS